MSQEPMGNAKSFPIIMHVDGEILTIGRATVIGDEMIAEISPVLGDKIIEAMEKGTLESLSVSFNTVPVPWHLPQMEITKRSQ